MFADTSLLTENQEVLDAQRRSIQSSIEDRRDAVALERIWTDRNSEVAQDKNTQAAAERDATELLTAVDAAQKARDTLAKNGEAERELVKLDRKITALRDRLADARDTAEKSKRIAAARQKSIDNWLQERFHDGPTNLQIIEAARLRDKTMRAVS
jgi:hypothetical protein